MRALRWCWAPIGLMGRIMAWVMLPPLGLVMSWRKGRNRRHRQLVYATRRNAQPVCAGRPVPPPGRCVYPLCDCPTSGPCQRP